MGADPLDPRGLIVAAYDLEGLAPEEWRAIFFDWAFGLKDQDPRAAAVVLAARHADQPDHPLTLLLKEAAEAPPPAARRGERSVRRTRWTG